MSRISTYIRLASTKLASRKILTTFNILISSVSLTAVLVIIMLGLNVMSSSQKYLQVANPDGYRVLLTPNMPLYHISNLDDEKIIQELRIVEKSYIESQKQKDPNFQLPEYAMVTRKTYTNSYEINSSSPIVSKWVADKSAELIRNSNNKRQQMMDYIKGSGAVKFYPIAADVGLEKYFSKLDRVNIQLLTNGSENLRAWQQLDYGDNAIKVSAPALAPQGLLDSFVQYTGPAKGIPVVVSIDDFVDAFGKDLKLSSRPKLATDVGQWITDVKKKAIGYTYQLCYRNDADVAAIGKYLNQLDSDGKILAQHTPCSQMESAISNPDNDAEPTSIQQVGKEEKPERQLLTFQVVGLFTDNRGEGLFGVRSFTNDINGQIGQLVNNFASFTTNTSIIPIYTPVDLYNKLPDNLKISGQTVDSQKIVANAYVGDIMQFASVVAVYSNVEQAENVISSSCAINDSDCERPYGAIQFGSNYLMMDGLNKIIIQITVYALLIAFIICGLLTWINVSKIIADSRKETAVYRAIGASRRNILGTYITYVLLLAIIISVVAFVCSMVIAYVVDAMYAPKLTAELTNILGISSSVKFDLFAINSSLLVSVGVIGIFMVILVLASLPSILINTLRTPARDLRTE